MRWILIYRVHICMYVCMYQIFDFDYSDSDMVEILIVGIHIHTMHQVFEPLSDGQLEICLVSTLLGCEVGFVMF